MCVCVRGGGERSLPVQMKAAVLVSISLTSTCECQRMASYELSFVLTRASCACSNQILIALLFIQEIPMGELFVDFF